MIPTASLVPDPPRRRNEEEKFGRTFAQYMRFALPDNATFTHIPLGGQRHSRAAARLAAMGTKAGWPDYIIVHNGNAIFIELKTDRGSLSAVQKQVHEKLRLCGATVLVARSIEGIECALLEMGIPLRATTSGSRPMRVGGAAQQGLGV